MHIILYMLLCMTHQVGTSLMTSSLMEVVVIIIIIVWDILLAAVFVAGPVRTDCMQENVTFVGV